MITHGSSAARRSEIFDAQFGLPQRRRAAANGVSAGDHHALATGGEGVWEVN